MIPENEHAKFELETYNGTFELTITPHKPTASVYPTWKKFDTYPAALEYAAKWAKRVEIIRILESYTTDMENYGYFGSNYGVPQDDYDEIADRILLLFDSKPKKTG